MMTFLHFAVRSLARRPLTAVLLVFGLGIAFGLPGAAQAVVSAFERELTNRAAVTPLVLGARGSRADLVLHALYFQTAPPSGITVGDWKHVEGDSQAVTVPLCVRATAGSLPIVGTNGEYFRLRHLALAAGKPLTRLGDCVAGSEAATRLGIRPGGHLTTDLDSLFSIGGGVPVRLRVVGTMRPTGTADDAAVFVSLDTAWLIAGLGHSHARLTPRDSEPTDPRADGGFIEVTEENAGRFHFHGNRDRFPLTAVLIAPADEKTRLRLIGRYLNDDETVQLAEADHELRGLLDAALRLQRLYQVHAALTALATVLLCAAVVALTMRLRWSEVRTMSRLGLSNTRIVALFATEFALIAVASIVFASMIVLAARAAAPGLFRWLVL